MKTLKRNLLVALSATMMLFIACGGDEDDGNPQINSSASVDFQNKTWTKVDTTDVTFDGVFGFPITAIVASGSESIEVRIEVPYTSGPNNSIVYEPGVFTKATSGEDGNVTISTGEVNENWEVIDSFCIGNDPSDLEDTYCDSLRALADYRITITAASASSLSGEFEATVVNYSTGALEDASGEFTAIDPFGNFLGGLQ